MAVSHISLLFQFELKHKMIFVGLVSLCAHSRLVWFWYIYSFWERLFMCAYVSFIFMSIERARAKITTHTTHSWIPKAWVHLFGTRNYYVSIANRYNNNKKTQRERERERHTQAAHCFLNILYTYCIRLDKIIVIIIFVGVKHIWFGWGIQKRWQFLLRPRWYR